MNIISETIDINLIDHLDTMFKISTDRLMDDLMESIKNIGLITPLILQKRTDNLFTVISGFRRLFACRRLGWRHVDARVVATNDYLSCLKIAIADNANIRELNVIEQAEAISKLADVTADEITLVRNARESGLVANVGLVKKLKTIGALHGDLKNEIADGAVSLTIALELGKCEFNVAMAFVHIIRELNPTLNHQKEIMRVTREIARRENVSIAKVIDDHILPVINNSVDLDRNQKIRNIRHKLKQLRYPEMVRVEADYGARLKQLGLPESIQLIPPVDFEGNTYTLNLKFQNLVQFREILTKLHQTAEHPDFAVILEKAFEDNKSLY